MIEGAGGDSVIRVVNCFEPRLPQPSETTSVCRTLTAIAMRLLRTRQGNDRF